MDDEAVEEDDSDNDLFHFQENEEDDGFEDSEELNDMIATGYEEQPIDNDKRNELHQKWLEQQDAAGTDNLLQRLNYGSKFRDENLLDEEEGEGDGDGNEEERSNEAEDEAPRKLARINYRKAKEMIAQTFFDKKDDAYLSDDEETKKRQTEKQLRLLDKVSVSWHSIGLNRRTEIYSVDRSSYYICYYILNERTTFGMYLKLQFVHPEFRKINNSTNRI